MEKGGGRRGEKSVERSREQIRDSRSIRGGKREKQLCAWKAFLHLPRSTAAAIMEYLKFSSGKHTWDTRKFSGKEAG